jgi:glutamine phosphoribosylpyrophosphate amidotransferase
MCGVIGFRANDNRDLNFAKYLLAESQIRGKHSTGVSILFNKEKLITTKDNISARIFIDKYWDQIEFDIRYIENVSFLAHTRYSTSGEPNITNAQPIADDELAISMNGVITQSSPDKWKNEFDVKCVTTNDTEIAFHKMKQGINPLTLSKSGDNKFSMAVCSLSNTGRIQFFRNGRRPLYYALLKGYNDFAIVASTKQIIERALAKCGSSVTMNCLVPTTPGLLYELFSDNIIEKGLVTDKLEDWQNG